CARGRPVATTGDSYGLDSW
nr:immunoglobulin heavy chain junction region [Macaca mulatta]MOV41011.1 immunoglobulin heavy chain junction region [Macaca mulatta]MOV42232.1 immunoglobulin heavy chain junction region [Macaca mulatta]MOV42945.1 immunoglobulin heavy chain junction region [Macaca mulatta]MOV44048.1 immunoglobulin heavy chain junction region [Macaca mulatta]